MTAPLNRKIRSAGGGFDFGARAYDDSDENTASTPVASVEHAFDCHRRAALALLQHEGRLTRKAGSFLGQLCVDPTPMTLRQREWLDKLLARAELPALAA